MAKKKILVPITKSKSSQKILKQIESFLPAQDSELILYYVTKPPKGMGIAAPDYRSDYGLEPAGGPIGPKPHPVFASQEEDSMQSNIEVALLPISNELKEHGYDVSTQICFGENVVSEIVRIVKRDKVDMIAMATRARVGVRRFFFGDIAEKVAQRVQIPVLLIPPKG